MHQIKENDFNKHLKEMSAQAAFELIGNSKISKDNDYTLHPSPTLQRPCSINWCTNNFENYKGMEKGNKLRQKLRKNPSEYTHKTLKGRYKDYVKAAFKFAKK